MSAFWLPPAFVGVDIESTGTDVEQARTVQIALVVFRPGYPPDVREAVIDPGCEIPDAAAAVHGITTERARAEGKPADEVLDAYLADIADTVRVGLPLVVMNAPYDLTVLDRDARRNGVPVLEERLGGPVSGVVDPSVLDRRFIRYRRRVSATQGPRQLKTLAQVYGVGWDDGQAHGAGYDALQAGNVVARMAEWCRLPLEALLALRVGPFDPPAPMRRGDAHAFRAVGAMSLPQLHSAQAGWYRIQSEDYAQYLRTQANEIRHRAARCGDAGAGELAERDAAALDARVDTVTYDWPMRPLNRSEVAA